MGRGQWQGWERADGNGGWLRLACHFQLMQSPWTHGPVWIKNSRPGPLKASLCAFNCFSVAPGARSQTVAQPCSPRSNPFTLVSLSSTLACPPSQRVRNSLCPRALAFACPQAACHTSPWFPHSPQLRVTSGEGEEGLSLPHHSFLLSSHTYHLLRMLIHPCTPQPLPGNLSWWPPAGALSHSRYSGQM